MMRESELDFYYFLLPLPLAVDLQTYEPNVTIGIS